MADCTLDDMTVAREVKHWRSSCVCGWASKLCGSKAAALRSRFFHVRDLQTVSSRRSRRPFRLPTGAIRVARYDSAAEACLDAKGRQAPTDRAREKRKRDREEAKVKKAVRADCEARDGYCRYARALAAAAGRATSAGRGCVGPSAWAHWGPWKRFKTRGQPPEQRHTTRGSLMLCQDAHEAYDRGRLQIEALTDLCCDGPLRFASESGTVEEPPDAPIPTVGRLR